MKRVLSLIKCKLGIRNRIPFLRRHQAANSKLDARGLPPVGSDLRNGERNFTFLDDELTHKLLHGLAANAIA